MASDYNMHVTGETNGFGVNPIGEYAATAKRHQAPGQGGALDMMSDGSMNYLSHNQRMHDRDVKKVRRSKIEM